MPDPKLHLVETLEEANQFMSWLGQRRPWLGVDTETGGLDWWRDDLRVAQIGDAETGWVIPWQAWGGVAKQALESYGGNTVMHNSKFDLHFLEHNGVTYPRHMLHDTMPMVGILEPEKAKGLKPASERHVMTGASAADRALKAIMSKNKWTWASIPIDTPEYWVYAAMDVVLTSRLAEKIFPLIEPGGFTKTYETEVAVAQVLCDMERRGLLVDIEYSNAMIEWILTQETPLVDWFKREVGVDNPFSDAQMVRWFQAQGHVFTKLTKKMNIAFDATVLNSIVALGTPYAFVASEIIRLRRLRKIRTTYFEDFVEFADSDNRVHTSINPMKAITARMSSERPNLQNVPARRNGKMVRDAFYAPQGSNLISADFDQIEYRILVDRSGEQGLIDAINAGQDLHTYMTSVVYKKRYEDVEPHERSLMKNATFAFLYGAGNAKFADMAEITEDAAVAFRDIYIDDFPAINAYSDAIDSMAKTQGWARTPYLGRKQATRSGEEGYKLLNYVTQGEAGDVLKWKMVELSQTDAGQYMRLPIHDEVLFEVPNEYAQDIKLIIEEVMPETKAFKVPLSVSADIINRWGDKYD